MHLSFPQWSKNRHSSEDIICKWHAGATVHGMSWWCLCVDGNLIGMRTWPWVNKGTGPNKTTCCETSGLLNRLSLVQLNTAQPSFPVTSCLRAIRKNASLFFFFFSFTKCYSQLPPTLALGLIIQRLNASLLNGSIFLFGFCPVIEGKDRLTAFPLAVFKTN